MGAMGLLRIKSSLTFRQHLTTLKKSIFGLFSTSKINGRDLFFLTAGLLLILLYVGYNFVSSPTVIPSKKGNKNVIIKGEISHSVNAVYSIMGSFKIHYQRKTEF